MKRPVIISLIVLLAAVLLAPAGASAQKTPAERDAWLKELTRYKHEFLAKELRLSAEQQKAFFPLYDAMEADTRSMVDQVRRLERQVRDKGASATDLEREKAAEALFELKGREAECEMRYFAKFKGVLSPAQLFELRHAERKFNRTVIKEHRKHRRQKK